MPTKAQINLARSLAAMVQERKIDVVAEHVSEALEAKQLRPEDFSVRAVADAFLGRDFTDLMGPGNSILMEAAGATSLAGFSRITILALSARLMEGYVSEEFVATKLVDSYQSQLEVERIPGVTGLGDQGGEVGEADSYPLVGVTEDYMDAPITKKYGMIFPVTKEAIFFDRTGLVMKSAMEVGQSLGLKKEKRILDCIVGSVNNHNWKGTPYNTYQASTPWVNVLASNELVDWTDIDASNQIFAAITDPNTGEPIMISPTQILVTAYKEATASRILQSTQVRFGDGASSTVATYGATPLGKSYEFFVSKLMQARAVAGGASTDNAKNWWFHGDFRKAFAYRENWPITVVQAPPNSQAEFERDIALQVKASERGVCQVMNPRFVVKNYLA